MSFYHDIVKNIGMNSLLNSLNFKSTRGIRVIIVDGTDIQIDLNMVWSKNF
jgi:hypothetical protein